MKGNYIWIFYIVNVNYPLFSEFYKFLGKSTANFKILRFPYILLQSKDGYYILSQMNEDLEDEIILVNNKEDENKSVIRQNPFSEKKKKRNIDLEKIMQLKGAYDSIISEINKKKIELINKKKELKTLIEERKNIYEEKHRILSRKKNLEITKKSWNRLITLKETGKYALFILIGAMSIIIESDQEFNRSTENKFGISVNQPD